MRIPRLHPLAGHPADHGQLLWFMVALALVVVGGVLFAVWMDARIRSDIAQEGERWTS